MNAVNSAPTASSKLTQSQRQRGHLGRPSRSEGRIALIHGVVASGQGTDRNRQIATTVDSYGWRLGRDQRFIEDDGIQTARIERYIRRLVVGLRRLGWPGIRLSGRVIGHRIFSSFAETFMIT